MRYDKDYVIFAGHFDWFKVVSGVGYVPTEKAPKEAREAMERYNKNNLYKRKKLDECKTWQDILQQ